MGISFEGRALESADIDIAFERATKVLVRETPHEEDFIEPYGEESVGRDLAHVEKLRSRFGHGESGFSSEQKKVADIFEALVLENGELSEWFGSNAFTIKTAEFDDFENGVDLVIEFRGDEPGSASFLGLAADITFTSDTSGKFNRIKEHIDKGDLSRVKYFHSGHMNIHGQLSKLPEVIIGADRKTVLELADLWMEKKNKALGEHKIQIMILEQMRIQLETFALYADSIGKKELAAIFRDRHTIIDGILKGKKEIYEKVKFNLGDDQVHSAIMTMMQGWNKELKAGK